MPIKAKQQTKKLVNIETVAAHFDVHPETVRRWLDKGCPHFKPSGQTLRFKLSDVEAWAHQTPVSDEGQS